MTQQQVRSAKVEAVESALRLITQGEWRIDSSFSYDDGAIVATVDGGKAILASVSHFPAEWQYNAHFIADAPKMLAALLGELSSAREQLDAFKNREMRLSEDGNGLSCVQAICPHGAPTPGHCVPCMDRCLTHTLIDMRDLAAQFDRARALLSVIGRDGLTRHTMKLAAEFGSRSSARSIEADATEPATTHNLKVWPQYFDALVSGEKSFELRKDDREPRFAVGDLLVLHEWTPPYRAETEHEWSKQLGGDYTGREIRRRVTYVARGGVIPEGFCVMSVVPAIDPEPSPSADAAAYRFVKKDAGAETTTANRQRVEPWQVAPSGYAAEASESPRIAGDAATSTRIEVPEGLTANPTGAPSEAVSVESPEPAPAALGEGRQ